MFLRNLDIPSEHRARAIRSGQPHIQTMQAGQGYFGPAGREKPSSSLIALMQTSNQRSSRTSLHIYRRTARDLQIKEFCNRIGRQPDIGGPLCAFSTSDFKLRRYPAPSARRPRPGARGPAPAARRQVDLCCIAVYMKTRGDWFAIPAASPPAHAPVAASREARSCPPKTGRCLRTC